MKFTSDVVEIASKKIIHLPEEISAKLPSRGMVMANISFNDKEETLPIEPDGKGGHWFEIEGVDAGSEEEFDLELVKDWPEPDMPKDIMKGIEDEGLIELWESFTTKARWEWLRWIRSTNNPETRAKRIVDGSSKMKDGKRRPCCFNSASCTVPEVSKSGVLKID